MIVAAKDLGKAVRSNTAAQADALRRAAVRSLTRAAGMAQDRLIEAEKKVFKAPVAFTTNTKGYKLTPARTRAADPQSKMGIKPKQSDYLRLTITGGTRKPGDAGTSDKFVWKPTRFASVTASGALQRFFTKQLVSESKRKRPIRGGGVFFGTMHKSGETGFILRPGRTLPFNKKGRGGEMVLARPSDHARVRNVSMPHMLPQADKKSEHHAILPYADIMRGAMDDAIAGLPRRLDQELGKLR